MWEVIGTKAAGVVVMAGIFIALALLLRFLYGPKGRFRESYWDAPENADVAGVSAPQGIVGGSKASGNTDGALQTSDDPDDALKMSNDVGGDPLPTAQFTRFNTDERGALGDITAYHRAFDDYAQSFYSGEAALDEQLDLKREHTGNVVRAARAIADAEPTFADPALYRALLLAAQFHDVGRFEQLKKYRTYADALSCNHALLGVKILRRKGFLQAERPELQNWVRTAVALHNRVTVPAGVGGQALPVLQALRDADKLDILRIMAEHLGPGCKPDPLVVMHLAGEGGVSPAIAASLESRTAARYADMRTFNDFRILLCTWLFEFHFPASLAILAESGRLETVLAGVDDAPQEQAAARRLLLEFLGPHNKKPVTPVHEPV